MLVHFSKQLASLAAPPVCLPTILPTQLARSRSLPTALYRDHISLASAWNTGSHSAGGGSSFQGTGCVALFANVAFMAVASLGLSSFPASVPAPSFLRRVLGEHRKRNAGDGYIFAGPTGAPLNLANLVRRVIKESLKGAGVGWRGWHAFRRGLATNLYRLGVPEGKLQAILRHSNKSITLTFYVKRFQVTVMRRWQNLRRRWATIGQRREIGMLANSFEMMVGLGRVELPTRSLGNCCSIHLSYSPIVTNR